MNLKRKREKGRVAMGATEFESVSGYHLGPKRKLRAKELAVATALCSVFKKKIPQNTVLGLRVKMFSAL